MSVNSDDDGTLGEYEVDDITKTHDGERTVQDLTKGSPDLTYTIEWGDDTNFRTKKLRSRIPFDSLDIATKSVDQYPTFRTPVEEKPLLELMTPIRGRTVPERGDVDLEGILFKDIRIR
ncbi:MAG: hypothetical protein Q9190_004195 [Brigantiaea leucoxantha]